MASSDPKAALTSDDSHTTSGASTATRLWAYASATAGAAALAVAVSSLGGPLTALVADQASRALSDDPNSLVAQWVPVGALVGGVGLAIYGYGRLAGLWTRWLLSRRLGKSTAADNVGVALGGAGVLIALGMASAGRYGDVGPTMNSHLAIGLWIVAATFGASLIRAGARASFRN